MPIEDLTPTALLDYVNKPHLFAAIEQRELPVEADQLVAQVW